MLRDCPICMAVRDRAILLSGLTQPVCPVYIKVLRSRHLLKILGLIEAEGRNDYLNVKKKSLFTILRVIIIK